MKRICTTLTVSGEKLEFCWENTLCTNFEIEQLDEPEETVVRLSAQHRTEFGMMAVVEVMLFGDGPQIGIRYPKNASDHCRIFVGGRLLEKWANQRIPPGATIFVEEFSGHPRVQVEV